MSSSALRLAQSNPDRFTAYFEDPGNGQYPAEVVVGAGGRVVVSGHLDAYDQVHLEVTDLEGLIARLQAVQMLARHRFGDDWGT
jgi:hypothetical protein